VFETAAPVKSAGRPSRHCAPAVMRAPRSSAASRRPRRWPMVSLASRPDAPVPVPAAATVPAVQAG